MVDDDGRLPGMSAEQFQDFGVQSEIVATAYRFLGRFYTDGVLKAAWSDVDPLLRLCWAQWWLGANDRAIVADGFDRDEVADSFVTAAGLHPLWVDFARVILRDFRAAFPVDVARAGIGSSPRVLDLDVELLYVHKEVPEGGQWAPGERSDVIPLVLKRDGGRWRVLNLGHARIPEPGWPPVL